MDPDGKLSLFPSLVFFIFNHFPINIPASPGWPLLSWLIFRVCICRRIRVPGGNYRPSAAIPQRFDRCRINRGSLFNGTLWHVGANSGIAADNRDCRFDLRFRVRGRGNDARPEGRPYPVAVRPWRMRIGDIFGIIAASVIMFLVLFGSFRLAISNRWFPKNSTPRKRKLSSEWFTKVITRLSRKTNLFHR